LRGDVQVRIAMDRTVADLNIEHFKKMLASETDPEATPDAAPPLR
jgi:hypothetical protein